MWFTMYTLTNFQDDESLRKWKEQLLGNVDASAVEGTNVRKTLDFLNENKGSLVKNIQTLDLLQKRDNETSYHTLNNHGLKSVIKNNYRNSVVKVFNFLLKYFYA